jgi:hypothetical protein
VKSDGKTHFPALTDGAMIVTHSEEDLFNKRYAAMEVAA